MTSTGDDASRRLSDALDAILHGEGSERAERLPRPTPYELPEIVPATSDVPIDDEAEPTHAEEARVEPGVQLVPGTTPVIPSTSVPRVGTPAAPIAPTAPTAATLPTPAAHSTAWGDHLAVDPRALAATPGLREPGRQPRVRRVTRVVRHVDPWSTFKLALVFSLVGYLVVLTSGVLLWRVADSTGTLANVERWFTQFGWETFELKGGEIFHNAWIIGLFCAVGLTGGAVLLATLFNLVSDIVGGVRVTVLEEEVVERTASSSRRYVVRRSPFGASPGRRPAWNVDDEPSDPASAVEPDRATEAVTRVQAVTRVEPAAADWSVDDEDDEEVDAGADEHVDRAP